LALWREDDPEVFKATIVVAAERLDIQPLAVEKDYWVCEVLRTLVARHPGQVVFKGGTSLEKLRIIQRFSEDLDILVVGDYKTKRSAKAALRAMHATAASATGGACRDPKSGGELGTLHRKAWVELPLEHSTQPTGLADPKAVYVELGQTGGPNPSALKPVESLLSRELAGSDIGQWDDLASFEVTILHPGRTLIEKLLRVNNFVADPARRSDPHGLPRIGRQFYDIWALLGDREVSSLLDDKALFGEILTSAYEISQAAFEPDSPVPDGGFAASLAFDPSGEFVAVLRREHDVAMRDLYYGTSTPPSFADVLERVQSRARLLNPNR